MKKSRRLLFKSLDNDGMQKLFEATWVYKELDDDILSRPLTDEEISLLKPGYKERVKATLLANVRKARPS